MVSQEIVHERSQISQEIVHDIFEILCQFYAARIEFMPAAAGGLRGTFIEVQRRLEIWLIWKICKIHVYIYIRGASTVA